jgi:putative ABC transport system ATP-binding protein
MTFAVEAVGVRKVYRTGKNRVAVLDGVDLTVLRGEFVAVVGPSGSGKSTLLNVVGGLDRGFQGEVRVDGLSFRKLSDKQLSRLRNEHIGFVFQQFNLLEHLSGLENVSMPAMFASKLRFNTASRAREALDRVGLADRAEDLAANLSGGQKQRVAIARALFHKPSLLLCDEPTGNLDRETGRQIIELFTRLNREDGITLIVVTHETRASAAAGRVVSIEDGRVVSQQRSAQVVAAAADGAGLQDDA